MSDLYLCSAFQLIWMLHAQSTLINQVEVMPAGASKDFILRMLVTKRGYKDTHVITLINKKSPLHNSESSGKS